MTIISFAAAVVAITMVVLAAVLIPAVIEIRKTAEATRDFISRTDAELKPILSELRATLVDLKALTGGIAENVDELKTFMGAVGETGRGLKTIGTIVGAVSGLLASSSLWLSGAKVAGKFLVEKFAKKGR
ncbi:DUF948 domain-containing protein [Geobacter argillaceus]|uniref:Uncharacterized protein DUF948 n=1 Tax=Geobacter argillaceus TaxID=345631 RepID=A0A562WQI0_9BACT|nr:DUF948 domain-containing protein [Geobacter argillaceus]TWJ32485.1 uncharacterized protein DUF948 [Geobacter argillaceus]